MPCVDRRRRRVDVDVGKPEARLIGGAGIAAGTRNRRQHRQGPQFMGRQFMGRQFMGRQFIDCRHSLILHHRRLCRSPNFPLMDYVKRFGRCQPFGGLCTKPTKRARHSGAPRCGESGTHTQRPGSQPPAAPRNDGFFVQSRSGVNGVCETDTTEALRVSFVDKCGTIGKGPEGIRMLAADPHLERG